MHNKRLNLKWANKLLRAKAFVVLTDKEGVICMDGMDPNSLNDQFILQSQLASIEKFEGDLAELKARHQSRIRELGGKVGVTRRKPSAAKRSSVPKTKANASKSPRTKRS